MYEDLYGMFGDVLYRDVKVLNLRFVIKMLSVFGIFEMYRPKGC